MTNVFIAALRRYWNSAPADLRHNFSLDLTAAMLVGVYVAAINTFVPVVARRLGASPFLLSLITAAPAAGNILAVLPTSDARLRFDPLRHVSLPQHALIRREVA